MIEIRLASARRNGIAWFAPICSDDYEFLGVPDDRLKSTSRTHRKILLSGQDWATATSSAHRRISGDRTRRLRGGSRADDAISTC